MTQPRFFLEYSIKKKKEKKKRISYSKETVASAFSRNLCDCISHCSGEKSPTLLSTVYTYGNGFQECCLFSPHADTELSPTQHHMTMGPAAQATAFKDSLESPPFTVYQFSIKLFTRSNSGHFKTLISSKITSSIPLIILFLYTSVRNPRGQREGQPSVLPEMGVFPWRKEKNKSSAFMGQLHGHIPICIYVDIYVFKGKYY